MDQFLGPDVYRPSRNPYWAKIKQEGGIVLTDLDTESHQGHWRQYARILQPGLRPDCRLIVEIGCNGGHVLTEAALRDPESLYIGIDWKFKQIHLAGVKARKKGVRNALFLRAPASRIDRIFQAGEVDSLWLFFPDPWPKKSQHKHRLITAEWLARAATITQSDGTLEIRTDHSEYFESILGLFGATSRAWQLLSVLRDRHANNPNARVLNIPEVTLFERLFIQAGTQIQELRARKQSK